MENEKEILTDSLIIDQNIISFNRTLLQISNISNIDVEPKPKDKPNYQLAIPILLIGGVMIYINISKKNWWLGGNVLLFIGLILVISVLVYFFVNAVENSDDGARFLLIYLNSGYIYSIFCQEPEFLKEVIRVLRHCMNHCSEGQHIKIDFENCVIRDTTISPRNQRGEDCSMNISGSNTIQGSIFSEGNNYGSNTNRDSFNQETNMPDDELSDILAEIMENLDELAEEDREDILSAVEDAEEGMQNGNMGRLRNCMNTISQFISILNNTPVLQKCLEKLQDYIRSYLG